MEPNDPNDGAIRKGEPPDFGNRTPRPEPRVTLSPYPVAASCPQCGCKEFKRVKVNRLVAFTDDRECTACGTRYTPPTPVWAAVVFLLLGILITAVGVVAVGTSLAFDRDLFLLTQLIHLGVSVFLVGTGLACTVFGIRSLKSRDATGQEQRSHAMKDES